MKKKFIVVAHCTDGDVLIGENGVTQFSFSKAVEVYNNHLNLGANLGVYEYKNI